MDGLGSSLGTVLLATTLVSGLVSAAMVRITEGSPRQSATQCLFLACLGLVALATTVSLTLGPGYWLASGTSFSVMVLAGACEFGGNRKADPVYRI